MCLYKVNNKLYRLDLEEFETEEVVVVEVLEYDEHNLLSDANGNVISDDDLDSYCDSVYCDESDDINCYIYFNIVNK